MITSTAKTTQFLLLILALHPFLAHTLTNDGLLLLRFKNSILNDPRGVLANWNSNDSSPCYWTGVNCTDFSGATTAVNSTNSSLRVTSLVLQNSQLLGSVPPELGLLEKLQHLDLSGNYLNGTIPATLFSAPELNFLSLANNEISGEVPELKVSTTNLRVLYLSENALWGNSWTELSILSNLAVVSIANNYLSGELPAGGFRSLEFLDLSCNLINGTLPEILAGESLRFLNLSSNKISGRIPQKLGKSIPRDAVLDFSSNALAGEIPPEGAFVAQKSAAFAGNSELCGKPLKNLCTIPSSLSGPPVLGKSPPAFAAIPKDIDETPNSTEKSGLRPAVIAAIIIGDLGGIAILFLLFLFIYKVKKRNQDSEQENKEVSLSGMEKEQTENSTVAGLVCCLGRKGDGDDSEDSSEFTGTSESDEEDHVVEKGMKLGGIGRFQNQHKQEAMLVSVDPETELDVDTLLKASAYILGATESSIVYKAVLEDGTVLAVRRIGESNGIDKFKDFDAQVRNIAKFHHPNLLRLRGFYWGPDERLLIHDYAPNGSLANIYFSKKLGSSSLHLSWEMRLKIARGVSKGLAYLHEKKCTHGNVRPSNILLDADMEPKIGDLGLDRLMFADGSYKIGTSARQFGSARSMQSTSSLPDLSPVAGASPCGSTSTAAFGTPYHAPESLKSLKPNAKWDVYSFGMVLLELITGRVFSEVELCQWNSGEEKNRILRMVDPVIRGEIDGKEEGVLSCFKLGFAACALQPQKRPSMKEVVHVLEKVSPSSST